MPAGAEARFRFPRRPDVTWIGHPNWYFRISKHSLSFLRHRNTPLAYFADESPPNDDISKYVLKPLYFFAGLGGNRRYRCRGFRPFGYYNRGYHCGGLGTTLVSPSVGVFVLFGTTIVGTTVGGTRKKRNKKNKRMTSLDFSCPIDNST